MKAVTDAKNVAVKEKAKKKEALKAAKAAVNRKKATYKRQKQKEGTAATVVQIPFVAENVAAV
ncbi:hypothetical protein PC123_g9652 [Phytophthora cactorum]|nr:hypothetical protein PC123_g9652 [Phytophthora cactorum]